ncbi:hypothetical protein DL89DRAFT_266536 [Linderina pennispora]|uniref:Uncharacterized protein n=1 Tax=Linderina pennispora TaxID=61395 RepID=A0A1Y1WDB9_9FUNG|nr:uncharacterized protein DL89DRAFT_266536 [Linderina pennispora]ORX71533.1 hypothetical protein DL89DRAFT_266536 [Linderina pennispora]
MAIVGVVTIANSLALLSVKLYPAGAAWRNSLVYIDHVCANIGFWIINWEPFYQCLTRRDEYLEYWTDTLEGGIEGVYNLTSRFADDTHSLVRGTERGIACSSKDMHVGTYHIPGTLSELCLANKLSHD